MVGSAGRLLVFAGAVLLAAGLLLIIAERTHIPLLGRLPGDIRIERPGFSFYFPWVSLLLISLLLTVILNLILALVRR